MATDPPADDDTLDEPPPGFHWTLTAQGWELVANDQTSVRRYIRLRNVPQTPHERQ